ncbi:MAG: proprotein convertase P-domain-containing protein, partial [Crocinitomicaceae bacterium]|nr:proprotein convertase P-domain-containing protein [Crocinitomicaceae bacterium]
MKLHLSKALGLVLFLALSIQNTHAQCPVTAYASKSTVSCGDPVTLTAVASGCIPLNNNFNNGSLGTWSATTGAVVTNGNGAPNASYNCVGPPPEGANCLWMGATVSGTRTVTTNDYNLTSCGGGSTNSGSICFWMKYSTQGGPDPCEGIDLPAEGISVQYSTNGGANWTTLQYYDPNGGYDPVLTNWNYYCLNIPTAAIGPNTRFRWLQSQNSGAGFDTWGLDDVSIILNGPGYTYDWAHDAQGPASTSNTPDVNPTSTTTYTVTYTNGVETCTSDVTVNVILPTVSAAADKVLVCEGTPVNLTSQSSLVAVPITSCGINPDASCNPLTQEAGEVQVGNGTFVNTNNSISGNTFGDFGDNNMRTQIIYRANELIAAGMVPGQINNIQFNIASILTNGTYSNFRISIGCTSQNAFTSSAASFVGGLQNVYGPVTLPSMNPGWNTFFFDNSYNWDGTSNIVVQICWTTLSSDDREVYTMDHNTTFASLAQAVENNFDGFNVCTSTTFYDEYSRRPNTRFGYCKPRNIVLNYNWTSNPIGFTANTQNTTATPNGPTYYIVGVNNSGAPAGCTVYDSVLVDTYKPTVSVNPNPANICPPGTTSANLVSTSSTNPNFPAQRTFTNNNAQPIGDAGGGFVGGCGTAGVPITSVIAVNNIVPATLAANPVFQVAVNMNTQANGDYLIELISPSGNTITLKPAQTGAGANMTNTRFRTGGAAFGGGAAPYNGIFAPNQPFANLTGNVNGNWTLRVTDLCKPFGNGTSTGSLLSWSITFNTENYVSTYAWSPAAGLSSTNTANTVASPASSTVYTLTVTDAVGCSNSTTVPVNVNSAPSVPVNDTAICAGNSATLTAVPFDGGGGTYSWSPGGQTTQSITVTPGSTTGYTVSYSSGGCTGTGTGTVTVSPTPTVSVNSTTICSGQSTTLTATPSQPGGTYLWSNGATSASITVSPGSTQTYSVTYTLNGCTASQSGTVTVNPSPTVGVNNVTICNGQTANLTATPSVGGGTYSWFPGGQTSPSISVTPTSTTNYTVNYTLNGCTATNTGTVTVNALPSVTVNNPSICSGNSATLTATVNPSGGTFSWSPGGMTTNPVTVSPASTTVYTVTYTALNGCVNSANSTVTVNPSVTVAANDPTICAGQTATLTATPSTPGGTYSWTPGGATSQNLNVSPGTTTNYTVNYTLNGCTASDVATVTVNPVPTVTLASTTICSGTSTTLSPTVSPSGGTFSWSPGGQTTSSITVTPASTTNYTVNYTANGCSGSASATVTVQSPPSISVNSPTICSGQTATVTATPAQGGGTYSWSPGGQTTQTINVSPTSTTNYTVTYTIGGCSGTQTSTVTVNPTPTMTVNSPTICNGATATITASPTPMGGTYTWSPGGQTTQTINVSPTSTSNYTVNYSLNGCTANATSTVTVTPRPNVTVNNPTICSGQTATINATVSPTGGTYSWAPGGQTTASISVSPTTTSTYTVTYTGPSGCTNTATSTVTVNAASSVTVNDPTICNGSSATLTASPSTGGGAYLWSPGGATSQSITVSPSSTANYTVTYTANGCSSSDVGTITVNPIPTVNLANATVCN